MPLLIRTPRVESVLRELGPYPSGLNALDRKETAVQRQLRRAGLAGYEPSTQATLLTLVQLSRRPAEFFDVGAHIGLYSALCAAIFPPDLVHVTAFEPTPTTANLCLRIAEANRLQVRLERLALSDSSGSATLYISDKAETSNSLVEGFRPSTQSVEVAMTTLDRYCLQRGVYPTVMKIDVETFEVHVVRGALQTLRDARPWVVCELLPSADSGATREVLSIFADLGYEAYRWGHDNSWHRSSGSDEGAHLSESNRDWLFAPDGLNERFKTALREWLAAIATCTEQTNLLIPGGTKPPDGWREPYRLHDGVH